MMYLDDFTDGIDVLAKACERAGISDPGYGPDGVECDPDLTPEEMTLLRRCGWIRIQLNGRVLWTTHMQIDHEKTTLAGIPNSELGTKVLSWYRSGDHGISSEYLAATALDDTAWVARLRLSAPWPHDASDFGRCYRLVEQIPKVKELAFARLADHPVWGKLVAAWDDLSAQYLKALQESKDQESLLKGQRRYPISTRLHNRIKRCGHHQ